MENIEQKLEEIEELIKNMGGAMGLPVPKLPKPPTLPTAPKPIQASAGAVNQKNPVKVAQQIQDPVAQKVGVKNAKSFVKFDNNGQWKLEDSVESSHDKT